MSFVCKRSGSSPPFLLPLHERGTPGPGRRDRDPLESRSQYGTTSLGPFLPETDQGPKSHFETYQGVTSFPFHLQSLLVGTDDVWAHLRSGEGSDTEVSGLRESSRTVGGSRIVSHSLVLLQRLTAILVFVVKKSETL